MKNNFIKYIESNQLFSKNDKILLALSGGIDSICLANLFLETKYNCLLYTSPSPRDKRQSRMPSSA